MSYINTIQKRQTFEYNQPNKPKRQQLNDFSLSYNSVNPNNVIAREPLQKTKTFTSRYVNDSGKWTQNAVNDGFVKFDDYINDIKNTTEKYASFNGKEFKTNSNGMPVLKNQFMMDDTYYENSNKEIESSLNLFSRVDAGMGQKIGDYFKRTADQAIQSSLKIPKWYANAMRIAMKSTDPSFHKDLWKWGAENYLRKEKECYTSAWMLEHSLEDNPSDIWRGDDSRIANLIKNDPVYLNALDKAIENSDGKTLDTYLNGIEFNDDDLYLSIHKANIRVKGYKRSDGKWEVKAQLTDKYDFTEVQSFMGENGILSKQASVGTVANDAAVYSQKIGAIKPYRVTVNFNTVR